jgi:hypothetical protein
MIQLAYAILWWFVMVVIGLIAFPLVSRVCSRLPDKGYSISKILGLLLLGSSPRRTTEERHSSGDCGNYCCFTYGICETM